jgi:hypothetical protein
MAALRNFEGQDVEDSAASVEPGGSTQAVHGGTRRHKPFHSLNTPIVQTATYTFANTQELIDFMQARTWGNEVERKSMAAGNPRCRRLVSPQPSNMVRLPCCTPGMNRDIGAAGGLPTGAQYYDG